jgi:glucosylceramidase
VALASVQNEPEATQTWDSCIWTAEEEGEFVAKYLGPTLEKEKLGDVDILIWDHNRDAMVRRASQTIGYPGAARYIHGTAYHWYNGEEFQNVSAVHKLFPDKHLYFTEGSIEKAPALGEWHRGERYAHHIINDVNNWCEGWIDWNMILTTEGGPNHVQNLCDAPVLVDTHSGEVIYQSPFWYLGHFSKFVRPGYFKIACNVCGNIMPLQDGSPGVEATAFSKTGNEAVAIVLNRTEKPYRIHVSAFGWAKETGIPPRSITSFQILAPGQL